LHPECGAVRFFIWVNIIKITEFNLEENLIVFFNYSILITPSQALLVGVDAFMPIYH